MFLFSWFNTATVLNDHYLVVVGIPEFWVSIVFWLALLFSIPVLANLSQPQPRWKSPVR